MAVKIETGKQWRLVHDNKTVMALIEGLQTVTETVHDVLEFDTEDQAMKAIEALGLEYDEDTWNK